MIRINDNTLRMFVAMVDRLGHRESDHERARARQPQSGLLRTLAGLAKLKRTAGKTRRAGPGYSRRSSMAASRKTRPRPPKKPMGGPRTFGRLQQALDETARREISAALEETGGAVVAAAKVLGISKVSLWRRMKALGITVDR